MLRGLMPGALALACALAGCSQASTAAPVAPATPLPSPTYTCTPAGQPIPCTGEQYTAQEKRRVLVTQARAVYTRYFNESARLYRRGGATQPTAELKAVAAGPYLAAQQATFARLKTGDVRAVGGDFKLVRLGETGGTEERGFEVALGACVDGRTVQLKRGDAVLGKGRVYAETVYLRREGTALRIAAGEGKTVPAC